MKRGTRIEYRYAAGKVVSGKVIRTYTDKEISTHAKTHGPDAAAELPNWIVCELSDEDRAYQAACHISQLSVIDHRL